MTIRGRLSLWYSLVVFAVLVAAGVSVLVLQARLGLARVDAELEAAAASVASTLRNELDEGQGLVAAVRDMVIEVTLARQGYGVVSAEGTVIGASGIDGGVPLAGALLLAAGGTPTTAAAGATRIRIRARPPVAGAGDFRVVTWMSLEPLDVERATLGRTLLLGIPVAVLLAVLGGLTIGRRALAPLSEMAAQAAAIRLSDLDARLTVANPSDELGRVALAFNALLDRLALSLRQQRTFMADASHQLRTPVSVVRTTAQVMLQRGQRGEVDYREALDVVARQAERLTKLVNDMFTLAMADAQARPLQLAPFYLDEMVVEVVKDLGVLAAARHVRLDPWPTIETLYVGEEQLLRQMLANLVENAIKHTPEDGTVSVSVTPAVDAILVAVTDTGAGIGKGDVARIFERFVRLESSSADAGGGLGLPIARWIAEAHGGTVVLASTGATGSRFVVTLPLDRAPTA